mgnify:CR=1 FL=1
MAQSVVSRNIFVRIFYFYLNGFRSMTLGWTLWAIILIKLFIMFFILKLFFFPNVLNTNFKTDAERAELALPIPNSDNK